MQFLDMSDSIIEWASETEVIPYISPKDGKRHRYFVDFWVKKLNRDGKIEQMLIEIKPLRECRPPSKKVKNLVEETIKYAVNQEKWKAAEAYCKAKGWTFRVMTEYDLGIKAKK